MKALTNIFHLFFPNSCVCCEDDLLANEKELCLKCRFELPITHFTELKDNPIEELFFGRLPIVFATALLFYNSVSNKS